jgi:hypothetical protein
MSEAWGIDKEGFYLYRYVKTKSGKEADNVL